MQGLPDPCLNENSGGREFSSPELERAEGDGRVVLTLDKDFWQLALQRPTPLTRCGVILFRVIPAVPENLKPLVDSVFRSEHLWIGHVTTVTKDRIEMIATRGLETFRQ